MIVAPHSAIPSWYGYVYQGHVAIYYILKKMNQIIDQLIVDNKITEIDEKAKKIIDNRLNEYTFEIEWMEDFAIKYKGQYVSFHQVKASDEHKKIDSSALYDVIVKLDEYEKFENANNENEDVIGYFHVADNSIEIPKPEVIIENQIKIFDSRMVEYEKLLALKDSDLKKELKSTKDRTKHSYKKIFYDLAIIDKLKITIDNIENVRKKMKELADTLKANQINKDKIKSMKLVVYDECFSKLEKIEVMIIQEISEYYKKYHKLDGAINVSRIKESIFPAFIQYISNYIDKRKKEKDFIDEPFTKFLKILNTVTSTKLDTDYSIYLFRSLIGEYFNEYIEDYCKKSYISCNECEDQEGCNLTSLLNEFDKLSNKDVKQLIYNINVTRNINNGASEFPDHGCLHNTVFDFVKNIELLKLEQTKIIAKKNNTIYWCTTDNQDLPDRVFLKKLRRNRVNILDMLFEADVMISQRRNIDSVDITDEKIICLSEEEIEGLGEDVKSRYLANKDSIINTKKLKVIDFKTAKGELISD